MLDKINGKHDEPTQAHASAGRSPDPNPPTRPVPATAAAPAAATTNPKGGGDVKTSTTTEGSHPSEQDKKGWLKPLLITLALLVVAVLVIAGCRQLTPSGNNEPSGTAGQTTSESSPSASPTPNSPEETEQSDNAQTDTESETTEGEQADTETNSEPATHNSNAPPASSVQQSPASAGLPADVWTDDINWIWADSVESGLNVFSHANPKSPQELAAAIAASPAVLQAIPGWTGENVRFYQANSNVVWNQGRGMASIDEWGNITWGTDFVDPAGVVIAIDSAGNVLRIKCLNAGDGAPVATTAPATFPRLYEVKEPKAEQPAIGGPVGPKPTKPETVTVVEKPEKPNPTQPHKPEVPSKPEKPGEGGPEGPKPEEPHKPEEPEVPEEKLVKGC
ncbi:hypothetical protein FJZ39_00005, partial [Candidatus Saccharibacteria bacterium]|nr:hypothetical protein [Candidatus Saccharibacteria bacterium]